MLKKVEITPEVRDVLVRGEWAGWLFRLPGERLERRLYEATDKVLRALGGKWHRGHSGHMFSLDAKKAMEEALAAGHVVDQKKTLEQFFTPMSLARRMTDILGLPARGISHVLEPSAGDGRLVQALLEHGTELISAVEIDVGLARTLSGLIGPHGGGVWAGDFMQWTPVARAPIDAVIMNPPFSVNQDIRHVRQAFRWLRPGGKLAAIMSPHFTFAGDEASRSFRDLIGYPDRGAEMAADGDHCEVRSFTSLEPVSAASVELLPAGTFKDAGTGTSSVLVTLEKAE